MMKKTFLSTLALATLTIQFSATSHYANAQQLSSVKFKGPYDCDVATLNYKPLVDWVEERSSTGDQEGYVYAKVILWDANYIIAGCKAKSRGEEWDDSCLNGRRDLDEIDASIPDNLDDISMDGVREEVSRSVQSYDAAFVFCRDNNVYQ